MSPWLDAAGAADYLAVPVKRVRNLTAAGEIPHVREGGRVFYHRGQLDAWRLAQSSGPRFPVADVYDAGDNINAPAARSTLRGRTREVKSHVV